MKMPKRTWTKTKGHWPKGKPRHKPIAAARLARVRAWFAQHQAPGGAGANDRSVKRVALAIGVSDRSVRRWLQAVENPEPEKWRDLLAHLESLGF